MRDYSAISQITVTSSYEETNALLKDYWKLLDIFHDSDDIPLFVLGDQRGADMRSFAGSIEGKVPECR